MAKVPPSAIRRFFDILNTVDDVISLGIGEPDFVTPEHICQAGIKSLHEGLTSYSSNAGAIELRELIGLIATALGTKPRIKELPLQPGDVPITYADISKAQRLLGYSPNYPIERGVEQAVAWYREQLGQ